MSMTAPKGHFAWLDGFPPDVLAIEARGRVDHDAYADELIPAIEARIAAQGKVKLLYILGADFAGFTAGAALEDAKVGLLHLARFARVAVVSDIAWMAAAVRLFAPLIPCPVRVFSGNDRGAAESWIRADDAAPGGAEVAADHKLLPLEDRMPPVD